MHELIVTPLISVRKLIRHYHRTPATISVRTEEQEESPYNYQLGVYHPLISSLVSDSRY